MSDYPVVPLADMEKMAAAIANSRLFGVKDQTQALALMLISQAEGRHPALAAMEYHVISGRPALKADAMLARFQAAGGKVKWTTYTDEKVVGTFSHPSGGEVTVDWDEKRAKSIKVWDKESGKWTALGDRLQYENYPRNMFRARCISEGVRTVYPGCMAAGTYTPEELKTGEIQEEKVVEGEVMHTEQPRQKRPPSPPPAEQANGGRQCTDGEIAHIRSKLTDATVTLQQFQNSTGIDLDKMTLDQFNEAKKFLKDPAGYAPPSSE